MTDLTTNSINPQFEAAFVRKYGFGRMTASSNDEAMAMYAAAYWAWNEALRAVDAREAIEKAGVRVKE